MKFKFLIMCLLAFSAMAFGQITRDFSTVQALRNSAHGAKKGEKVYVTSLQNLYAVDFIDNLSTDDGYSVIIQGNTRWKCVSCNVPSRCITQANVNPSDPLNPTYNEIKAYVASQKVPNENGAILNYYKRLDTTGISDAALNFDVGYDSSRVSSIKINGVEKLTNPIWFYEGGVWVYPTNSIENLMMANKPIGVNYTIDDDDIEGNGAALIQNITGAIFTLECTTQYWDGSVWNDFVDSFGSPFYTFSNGSGSCSNPLRSYLIQDTAIVTLKAPINSSQTDFTDLTLGKSTLAGPRALIFSSTAGNYQISQQTDNKLKLGTQLFTDGQVLMIGTDQLNSQFANTEGIYLANKFQTSKRQIIVETAGGDRGIFQINKARGSMSSKQSLINNDKIGTFSFSGYNGQAYNTGALIESFVDGNVVNGTETGGQVPQRISFVTGFNSNNRSERLQIKADGSILIVPVTFAQLPTSNVVTGSIRIINDASTVTYRGNASGGGGNVALVMWTGSGWIYQ